MRDRFAVAGLGIALFVYNLAAPAQTAAGQEVPQMMQQGAEAMAAGHFNQAVADYTEVTRRRPDFAGGYFNLGLAEFQTGRLEPAGAALQKALHLHPGIPGANLFLGIIAYRQNRFEAAEDSLIRATHEAPRNAKAWMWLGVCYLAQDKAQAAVPPLDKAYALDPNDIDILYHRGRAYFLVANASYRKMFKLNPDSVRVHQVLGEAYAKGYRNNEAIIQFKLAVKMAPSLPGLHEELADQYWVVGRLDKAAAAYREELQIDPYSAVVKYKLGSLLVLQRQSAEGVKLLREALSADPSLTDAHYYLGSGLMDLGHDQQAIHQLRVAIAADPANNRAMSSYYKLAQLYRGLHQMPAAQDAMQNFLRMKAQVQKRRDRLTAQVVRSRSELPVDDPAPPVVAQAHPEN